MRVRSGLAPAVRQPHEPDAAVAAPPVSAVDSAPGALASVRRGPRVFRMPFKAMACGCEVVLAAEHEAQAQQWAWKAVAEVQRIEAKYSRYRDDSVVSRINAAAGTGLVTCDDETLSLLQYAATLHQASGGLFDITAGVLRRAWNFRVPRVPGADELAPLLECVDFAAVEIDGHHVGLRRAGMELDFGGFGKEYAADRAGALLAELGVQHGYVNLGGDMRFIGPKPDGSPWRIGIQHPRRAEALVATLPVERGGLATSGDYERYFDLDGRRYCHLLNPRTGMPVTHWQSISVLAPLAVAAGHCTTIAMLMEGEALAFLEATGVPYLAVDAHGQLHRRDANEAAALLSPDVVRGH
jgi:FAD:protein FMN transferase